MLIDVGVQLVPFGKPSARFAPPGVRILADRTDQNRFPVDVAQKVERADGVSARQVVMHPLKHPAYAVALDAAAEAADARQRPRTKQALAVTTIACPAEAPVMPNGPQQHQR